MGEQTYVFKFLIALDMFFSALIFRNPDITISSMTGLALKEAKPALWAKLLGGFLNKISTNHCNLAIEGDIKRANEAISILKQQ